MKNFKGKKVLIYGIGDSGRAVYKILHEFGACVNIYDDSEEYCNDFYFEKNPFNKKYDLIVISPGIKIIGNKLVEYFISSGQKIISELDFGYSFLSGKLIAITGTNGKTTTSMLMGRILKLANKKTNVCGNIGLPLSSISLSTKKEDITVCEVSNFQLETSKIFSPDIACLLNITQDHIDRHGSFDEYKNIKFKLLKMIKRKGKVVLNFDDENILSYLDKNKKLKNNLFCSKNMLFFSKKPLKNGVYVYENEIYFNNKKILCVNQIPLKGDKNLENVLAVIGISRLLGIDVDTIKNAILSFKVASHRLEEIGEINGILYVDDSKATNIDCIENAISAYKNKSIILLLGGRNKNCDFSILFQKNYVFKNIICFGESGNDIAIIAQNFNYKVYVKNTMKDAVNFAKKIAEKNDIVLLSPGCASFDEFESYAHRGDVFKNIVLENNEKI